MEKTISISVGCCPLCGKEINKPAIFASNHTRMSNGCKNGCFTFSIDLTTLAKTTEIEVNFFNEDSTNTQDNFRFALYLEEMDADHLIKYEAYTKRLAYWKENERYLAEILRRC